ncbi:MAG TPA: hypothetical protein VMH81_18995 [Bryobacteraceae bacterium]|nr:hypothetical protein [Bryobacteraceae bacterium]
MGAFSSFVETVMHGATAQKVYSRIADDHVLDAGYGSAGLAPDQAYFTISLSKMFLADARKLWQGFAPMTIAAAEFQYGGQKQSVPYVVGKELLASIQSYLKDQNIEYRNTRMFGPCPYTGGGLSLFIGLFRTAANSASTEFFSLLADVAGAFELTGLSGYLPVAKVVTSGLGRLLGLSETTLRIGARDEFSEFREGFLAYVNCSAEELGGALWTKGGELLSGATADSARPVTRYDHCLVRIASQTERNDYTSLPFHACWKKTSDLIWAGQEEKARSAFLELVGQVAGSPDLTARHRVALLSVYRGNFEAELELYRATTGVGQPSSSKRAAKSGVASPKAALQSEALIAHTAKLGAEVEATLRSLAEGFPRLQEMRGGSRDLNDEVLSRQMGVMGTSAADPQKLADALMVAAFRNSG